MYVATCVENQDAIGVMVPAFNPGQPPKKKDRTTFRFDVEAQGTTYGIASKWFNISMDERAALYKFLMSWLGSVSEGLDTQKLVGKKCMLQVVHKAYDGTTYANIQNITPVPDIPAPAPSTPPQVAQAAIEANTTEPPLF